MKALLAVFTALIVSAPMVKAQNQLRQIQPRATPTQGVPGRYSSIITMSLKYYTEVQIMSFTKTEVTFTHQSGMVTLQLDDMPPIVQRACNYVPTSNSSTTTPAAAAGTPTPEQIENVRRSEVRRYIKIVAENGDSLVCQVWGIGSSRDTQVSVHRKAGRRLAQFKNEFLYPLHPKDRYDLGHEDAVIKGLKWDNKNETEMVLSLYLVKQGSAAQPYIYATSLTEAAKWLAEK